MNGADISARLQAALAPEHLLVQDDSHQHAGHAGAQQGRHFTVHITSARFSGPRQGASTRKAPPPVRAPSSAASDGCRASSSPSTASHVRSTSPPSFSRSSTIMPPRTTMLHGLKPIQ